MPGTKLGRAHGTCIAPQFAPTKYCSALEHQGNCLCHGNPVREQVYVCFLSLKVFQRAKILWFSPGANQKDTRPDPLVSRGKAADGRDHDIDSFHFRGRGVTDHADCQSCMV